MIPRHISGQHPEPLAGTAGVQRWVDTQPSIEDEADIAAQLPEQTPHTLRESGLDPQITHPPHEIRYIPGGSAGEHYGHRHRIGLLTGPLAVSDDAADRVPTRRPIQVVVGSDVGGDIIQARAASRQVHLIQQFLELAQRRRPPRPRTLQRPRPLRALLPAQPAASDIATHRTIVPDPASRHGVNSTNTHAH
ncbi:hypothetical protein [Streptomyces sp. DSM 41931]|uniref:hypothetical protein n=1 Tax=Streptomyces sp. DSM 41931 TaxID=3418367 RepID=UPI003D033780